MKIKFMPFIGFLLVIFSLLFISALESDWINGFNSATGEVREGGDVPSDYFGEIKCEHSPCSFTVAGISIGFADVTSEGQVNNISAVLASNLSCSENYAARKTVSIPCSDCTFFSGEDNSNEISDIAGFGGYARLVGDDEETTPVINCIDGDNGQDIFNKGTVSFVDEFGQSYEEEDYCKEHFFNLYLVEYSCEGNTLLKKKSYPCSDSKCIDGACKKSNTCTDSDGGKDYFTKGTVTAEYPDGSIIENTDLCVWGVLQEFYCEDGSIKLSSDICSNSVCSDGACGCRD